MVEPCFRCSVDLNLKFSDVELIIRRRMAWEQVVCEARVQRWPVVINHDVLKEA